MKTTNAVKTRLHGVAALVAITALSAGCASSPELGPKDGHDLPREDLERVQVGDEAPDFTLLAYSGEHHTLSDYRNDKNVVLVFYRGHW